MWEEPFRSNTLTEKERKGLLIALARPDFLGITVRIERFARDLSIKELAAEAKCSPKFIYGIEHNKYNILTPKNLKRINRVFEVLNIDKDKASVLIHNEKLRKDFRFLKDALIKDDKLASYYIMLKDRYDNKELKALVKKSLKKLVEDTFE